MWHYCLFCPVHWIWPIVCFFKQNQYRGMQHTFFFFTLCPTWTLFYRRCDLFCYFNHFFIRKNRDNNSNLIHKYIFVISLYTQIEMFTYERITKNIIEKSKHVSFSNLLLKKGENWVDIDNFSKLKYKLFNKRNALHYFFLKNSF